MTNSEPYPELEGAERDYPELAHVIGALLRNGSAHVTPARARIVETEYGRLLAAHVEADDLQHEVWGLNETLDAAS